MIPDDAAAGYEALTQGAALIDLSARGLLELTGEDRIRFLNGQTTNDVASLQPGQSVYSAFVNAKGKMRADGNILAFKDKLWIDTEPGAAASLAADLDHFIIADDVRVENLTASVARLAVIGPNAPRMIQHLGLEIPLKANGFIESPTAPCGALVIFRPSFGADLFIEIFCGASSARSLAAALDQAVKKLGGRWINPAAVEIRRVELGIPRFGADMDENTLPPEAGIESRAVSYTKGCYIGQEVISRIKSVGRVNRHLAGLKFSGNSDPIPAASPLRLDSVEVGRVTSCANVPGKGWLGLGYVKRGIGVDSGGLKGDGFEATIL